MAFDDVKFYDGKCKGPIIPPGQFDCMNGQTINASLVCNFQIDCSNGLDEKNCGSCDFEDENICGWKDKSTGSYKWTRSGNYTTNGGPAVDHTTNTAAGMLQLYHSHRL